MVRLFGKEVRTAIDTPMFPSARCEPGFLILLCVPHFVSGLGLGRDLQVNYCQESYVYVLTAVRFATVMGCKDCTVVIGAAAGMVSLVERGGPLV